MAEYRTESLPEAYVIEAYGEIDISNVAELTRRVLQASSQGERSVVLDMSNVTHLDSSGIAAVISVHQHITDIVEGRFVLVLEGQRLRRTFELRGLDRVFRIAVSREAALELLRDPGEPAVRPPA